MEHVVSDERLKRIISRAYRAGEAGAERYTQLLADGPEVVRCRECVHYNAHIVGTKLVAVFHFCRKLRRETSPNNYCSWGERRQCAGAKEAV